MQVAFGKRCDKNPALKYFTAQDFNLTAQSVELKRGLKGFIYIKDEALNNGKLIIFCHGMGPGQIAYTTEIAYFCNAGFTVLAIDSQGCNFSDGNKIKGMYSGVQAAESAVKYARESELLKGYKIYLVGHSWGAYSALCASARVKVDGVVAISGPDTPSKTIKEASARSISKPFAAILRPFWWLTEFLKYGVKGNSSAAKSALKNGVPTLLIHGANDPIVTSASSAFHRVDGANVTKLLVNGKAHNPYNTVNAEKLLAELSYKMRNGEKNFDGFDFRSATEEDEEVMRAITQFIENN